MNYISADSVPMDYTFLSRRVYDEGRNVEYFNWLCDLIHLPEEHYSILVYELHCIEFHWIFDYDSNRSYDGFVLRYGFAGNSGADVEDPTGKHCTVLEALIGLAQRMNYILDDEDRGDRTRLWFWEMLDNMGLCQYNDTSFSEPYGRDLNRLNEIHDICERWMNREFDYDGYGSPFPLSNPLEDQRNLDMMRQMNAYIMEKHMYGDELL